MKRDKKTHPIFGAVLFALLLLLLLLLALGLLAIVVLGIVQLARFWFVWMALIILGSAILMFTDREEIIHAFAGHDWDCCVCRICGESRHDFRNVDGQSSKDSPHVPARSPAPGADGYFTGQ